MKEVLLSAAEAELVSLFHNRKDACLMRIAAKEMGHPSSLPQSSPTTAPQSVSPTMT
eukprot:CAMPEP_0202454898 /NCGR_PEP_ID=MMETSP1360-20130828/12540_1 /ASSEMBLY_ACC=CAM_ASM_000848 /TAXON_ID=515479 /ORGANISM="Licmophora paradoxa, Strain CCMP2313" /LENGTH=56 /DNA_ID=CAMNT_0049074333 /DNA_START=338 /DNA_END=508 /DNA_ORIENTATION=+